MINVSGLKGSPIRWDGNVGENIIFGWEGANLYTRYAYRQFIRPDGTPYWYTADPVLTSPADAQANIDGELDWASRNLVDCFTWDWYADRQAVYNGTTYTLITTVGATLDNQGTPPTRVHVDKSSSPTLTLGGTYAGLSSYWFRVKLGGARGTAIIEVSNNDGASYVVGDITSNATPQAIAGTSATLGFANGTYQLGAVYRTVPYWSKINEAFKRYQASRFNPRVKFSLLLLRNIVAFPFEEAPYANYTNMVPYWVALFKDPQYDRIGTSPVVYLYAGSSNAPDQWDQTRILELQTAVTAAGLGAPWFHFINCPLSTIQGHQAAGVTNCARTQYGGPQKAGPPGHNAWSVQVGIDVAALAQHSASLPGAPHIVVGNDPRPRMEAGLPYDQWTDEGTTSELEAGFQRMINWNTANPTKTTSRCPWYAGPEVGESGPVLPTAQNSDKFFRAWKAVASRTFAAAYSDHFTTEKLDFTVTGTWTNVQDIAGAFQGQEIQSSTTNDFIEIVSSAGIDGAVSGWTAPLTTGYRVYGNLNGVRGSLIYQQTGLAAGTYTVRCRVASSSSVEILRGGVSQQTVSLGSVSQVGIDRIEFIRTRAGTAMTTAITPVTGCKNAMVDAVAALFGGGSGIVVREGTTVLASFALGWGAASGGSATLSATPLISATVASGTANNVLCQDGGPATVVDCGVNTGNTNWAVAALNAELAAIAAKVDAGAAGGKIRLRQSTTTLVDLTLASTAFGAPAAGSMAIAGSPSGIASGAGTPDNCQVFDSDNNLVFDAVLSGVGAIGVGNTVTVTGFTISLSATGAGQLSLGRATVVAPENMTISSGTLAAAA